MSNFLQKVFQGSRTGLSAVGVLAMTLSLAPRVLAQSTGTIQGSVTDPANSPVPNAPLTVHEENTGQERMLTTDSAGFYSVPSLPVGVYRVEVKATGMAPMAASHLILSVGSTVVQDFTLKVASTSETVEVQATAPLIEASSVSVGAVVNQTAVQEVPLNGRHFVDLSLLTPGTVTPPANGFLTAPLRGQGSFSFNSAGAREDTVNFMINGINLNDPNQNQITFQPTINTVDEFKIDNQTFSAEYGRNSGAIVNIATRAGVNRWHGEAYDFVRNSFFDARNFSNPTNVLAGGVLTPNLQSPFKRNQFGADAGGSIVKDKTFVYMSYEGLRQRQQVPISTTTLTAAQFAQGEATSDPIVKSLLTLIPMPNSGTNQFVSSAVAPVNIDQGTVNFTQILSDSNRVNVYYAIQKDQRNEPPSTDANSFPGMGDQRAGQRQLLTINDSWAVSPTLVNEARIGFNRIHIVFSADNMLSAANYGIDSGVTAAIGLPQISIAGGFAASQPEFGGINGFPQGRGDNTDVASDTVSWIHGTHLIKFGAEYRLANSDNFSYTPGTFSFASVATFLADQANGFTSNASNRSNRTYVNSIGAFVTDSWKVRPTFTVQLGLRYDWYGTPTEAENRFVVYDPATNTLQHVGQAGGPSRAYNQSARNFEPRIGLAWNPFHNDKTVIRSAYAIMTDQPQLGLVIGLAANPPYAFPVSYSPTTSIPFVTLGNAFTQAGGAVSPNTVAHNYKDAYISEYNFNIQQQFAHDFAVMIGYFGSKGTDLNVERNYNQLVNGVHPIQALSPSSPIDPGKTLGNILAYESIGNSNYNGLWVTLNKSMGHGLQFSADYAWSKSIDDNSRNIQLLVVQDSNNIRGDRGPSDFDTRQRIVLHGVYDLPFKGNRLKEGWEIALVEQTQTGNPLTFKTSNTAFTGSQNLRPNITGPVITGFTPATNGSATSVTYIQNPSVFVNQGNAFGNLGRNSIFGPGFSNLDFALVKTTKITEAVAFQIRADAFDLLNQVNFYNPVLTIGSSTTGLITSGTRFPAGDFGSSRQLQLSAKVTF
ncbi:MAG TPA: TonB-dependent receptor [Bryobacteraceae bacterium]|nr:TonB-dependent receptor [Bryobacteraceae bacterium]